jgi:phage terminase small subunit
MTRRRERFIAEYLKDLNSAQAAIRAGFAPKSAAATGYKLLREPEIKAAVDAAQAAALKKINIDAEWVLTRLAKIADADIRKIFDGRQLRAPQDMDDDAAFAISSIEFETERDHDGELKYVTKVKGWDKGKALVDIGRYLKMFTEKVEMEHSGGINVTLVGSDADL